VRVVMDETYFEEWTALSMVVSHYDDINLYAVSEGFADRWTNGEIHVLQREATWPPMRWPAWFLLASCCRILFFYTTGFFFCYHCG
jgi:hypothetical protein